MMRVMVIVGCVVMFCQTSDAQLDQRGLVGATTTGLSTANFYYARPNDITIIVSIMGAVARPGRYEISKSIDLVNLLALAGGPIEGASDEVKIMRLVETETKVVMREIPLDLADVAKMNPSDLTLQPGDIIAVPRSGWATARTAFEILVGSAVIITAISQVILVTR